MKKKLIIGIGVLAIIVVGVFMYLESRQKATISTSLSSRSKEFLSKRQKEGDNPFLYANINEEEVKKGSGQIIVDKCFRMKVPFAIKFIRRDGECDYTLGILKPRGNIIAYQRSEKIESIDQVPGISMRRQSSHAYTESKIDSPIGKFVVFEKSVDGYEKNAFYLDGNSSYIVINMVGGDASSAGEFEQLLRSVEKF